MQLKYDSIEALENSISIKDVGRFKVKLVVSSMQKLFKEGKKNLLDGAKESAYGFFFKYMLLLNYVRNCSDGTESFKKELNDAPFIMTQLEKLKIELTNTYETVAKNNKKMSEEVIAEKFEAEDTKEAVKNEVISILTAPATCIENVFWMEIGRLEEYLKQTKNKLSYMIFDTRPAEEYAASHLSQLRNVNIPMDQFSKGITAAILETKLEGASQEEWRKRSTYNFVIIMGLDDNPNKTTAPVHHLYEIITKWDPNTKYENKPLLLEGGYERFAFVFPTHCTAIVQRPPKSSNEFADFLQFDNIEYPQLDQTIEFDKSYTPAEQNILEVKKPVIPPIPPDFDRSKKPNLIPTSAKTRTDMSDDGFDEPSDLSESPTLSRSSSPVNAGRRNLKLRGTPTSAECISRLKSLEVKSVLIKKTHEPAATDKLAKSLAAYYPPEERNKNKLVETPSYDRSKKPKPNEPAVVDPRRYDPISRKSRDMVKGYTGLQNYNNSCYINSVLQVLLHIDELKDYFLHGRYVNNVNRNSKCRGAIAEEMASMSHIYWSGNYSSISSKNIKRLVGTLNQRFLHNTQEDCHEFYMFLLHYLHEDLSYYVASPRKASEAEFRILKYMNNYESFIHVLFFGQVETRVTCHDCNYVSSTYTPFGCVTIEVHDRTLEECMELNYEPEDVEEFRCEKCEVKGIVTKKSQITSTPAIMTIQLKRFGRFKGNGVRSYHKMGERIDFPVTLKLPKIAYDLKDGNTYRLLGLCTHHGTMESGHYKSYCYDEVHNVWVCFDDASVTVVGKDLNNVRLISRDAYLLFYKRVEDAKDLPGAQIRIHN